MSRTPSPLYRELAATFQAYLNCAARNDVYSEALRQRVYQDEEGDWLAAYEAPTVPQA